MKKALVFIAVFCMLTTIFADTVAAASYTKQQPPLSMQIHGKKVSTAPILYKDKIFVPLRALGQALGYQINYSEKIKTMDLISKAHKVTVTVGYIKARVNGTDVKMDIAPILSNNSLYVPLSFVKSNFKHDAKFLPEGNIVVIDKSVAGSAAASIKPTAQKPAASTDGIFVMDKKVNNTEKAAVKSGIVYIPLRIVGESLGFKVDWSSSTKAMTLTKGNKSLVILSGKASASLNKQALKLVGTPYLSGGRLYVPMSLLTKSLGYIADYDSKLNKVTISEKTDSKPQTPVPQVPDITTDAANIINFAYDEAGGFPQIDIVADKPIGAYNTFYMTDPERLVIDIPAALVKTESESKIINQGDISKISINQSSSDPSIVRVVVELSKQKLCKVVQSQDKKILSVLYANIISPISYQKDGDQDVITLNGSKDLDISFTELSNPRRLALDVKGAVFEDMLQNITAGSELFKAVRIGQDNTGAARIVLDLSSNAYYHVEGQGTTAKILLSKYPFEFFEYNRYYNTSVMYLSPGKDVQYSVDVDVENSTVNVFIPEDLKLEAKRIDVNDNLIKYVDIKTEMRDGNIVTSAAVKMQDSIESEVISAVPTKLVKIRFKRKITSLQQLTIVVDAGHGGKDPGAVAGDGTKEKNLNLDVALKLEKHLNALGINTIMTRKDDTFVELQGRADIANINYADFFMSIHFNAFNKITNGIETLYYPNIINEEYTLNHRKIADIFHNEVLKATKRGSRGINARPGLAVLNKTKMPAILAELGFITNPEELRLAKTDKYKEDAARALTVSILKYFRDIQGVQLDFDPDSIYSLQYEGQIAQPIVQEAVLIPEQTTEQQPTAPAQAEVIQSQN